jgi:hypothetical protein
MDAFQFVVSDECSIRTFEKQRGGIIHGSWRHSFALSKFSSVIIFFASACTSQALHGKGILKRRYCIHYSQESNSISAAQRKISEGSEHRTVEMQHFTPPPNFTSMAMDMNMDMTKADNDNDNRSISISNSSFHLFNYLCDELKISVLSFVADAPFEVMPENYRKSSLTHKIPHVSRKFRDLSKSDLYWKTALERQVENEAVNWRTALHRICKTKPTDPRYTNESVEEIVKRTHKVQGKPSYKKIYQDVVSKHLRFKGPVFMKSGQVVLGEAYTLLISEPRYRLLIAQVMKDQPAEALAGGPVQGEPIFLHANRNPLAPKTPAVLVQVVRCQLHADGSADIICMPRHYVWIEKVWLKTGRLFYAQSLRMTALATRQMHQLVQSETMTNVMGMLAGNFDGAGDCDFLEQTAARPLVPVNDEDMRAALEEEIESTDDESWDEDDSDSENDSDFSWESESNSDEDSSIYTSDSITSL